MTVGLLRGAATTAALTALILTGLAAPGQATPPTAKLRYAPEGQAVKDSYIVILKENTVARSATGAVANRMAAGVGGHVGHVYRHGVQGFEIGIDEAGARRLASDPAVAYVEQNSTMRPADTQVSPPSWGLDRIDGRTYLDRDFSYSYPTRAEGMRVYVIDSGIQASHFEFEFRVTEGAWFVGSGPATNDCMGHGTHVAGTIGAVDHGVAKGVTLIPARVFDCSDTTTTAAVTHAVDWVHGVHPKGQPGVVNISITGGPSAALDDALQRAITFKGLLFSVAAGNQLRDACTVSPARVPGALTVGGLTTNDGGDGFSNGGPCVDVYAPSTNIISTWNSFDFATEVLSGTSMSAAHASGVAAMMWSLHPTLTGAHLHNLVRQTGTDVLPVTPFVPPQNPALHIPQVVTNPLPALNVVQRDVVSHQMRAAGGTPPYVWSAAGLPAGVGIDRNTGLVRGAFGQAGTFTVTVTATDAAGRTGSVRESWFARRDVCPTC